MLSQNENPKMGRPQEKSYQDEPPHNGSILEEASGRGKKKCATVGAELRRTSPKVALVASGRSRTDSKSPAQHWLSFKRATNTYGFRRLGGAKLINYRVPALHPSLLCHRADQQKWHGGDGRPASIRRTRLGRRARAEARCSSLSLLA